jgi:hypothetical protein
MAMRSRCANPQDKDWKNYGGRGITVCPEWNEFDKFWSDMSHGYSDDLTLDRIDVNGNYHKENCRWATRQEQGNNTRFNVIVQTWFGPMTVAEAARVFNLQGITIRKRMDRGWSGMDLFKPVSTTSSTQAHVTDSP